MEGTRRRQWTGVYDGMYMCARSLIFEKLLG